MLRVVGYAINDKMQAQRDFSFSVKFAVFFILVCLRFATRETPSYVIKWLNAFLMLQINERLIFIMHVQVYQLNSVCGQ